MRTAGVPRPPGGVRGTSGGADVMAGEPGGRSVSAGPRALRTPGGAARKRRPCCKPLSPPSHPPTHPRPTVGASRAAQGGEARRRYAPDLLQQAGPAGGPQRRGDRKGMRPTTAGWASQGHARPPSLMSVNQPAPSARPLAPPLLLNRLPIPGPLQALDLQSMGRRHWRIVGCSAVTGEGLLDGFDWLIDDIRSRIFLLD